MKRILTYLLLPLLLLSCNGGVSGNGTDKPVPEMPEPPENVKQSNVFIVDFFSTLESEGSFFDGRDTGVALGFINDQATSGKLSVAYMFDRSDFRPGENNPLTAMAMNNKLYQFFAQSSPTVNGLIEGTGIITRYTISDYDGACISDSFISGCTQPLPIQNASKAWIATARFTSVKAADELVSAKSLRMIGDAIVVGTVENSVKEEIVAALESHSLRVMCYGSVDTRKDLIVVLPAGFVCRGIESGKRINLPYFRVSIEKWM